MLTGLESKTGRPGEGGRKEDVSTILELKAKILVVVVPWLWVKSGLWISG